MLAHAAAVPQSEDRARAVEEGVACVRQTPVVVLRQSTIAQGGVPLGEPAMPPPPKQAVSPS